MLRAPTFPLTLACLLLLSPLAWVRAEEPARVADFAGRWSTAFGELTLTQEGPAVEGVYAGAGRLRGRVSGRRLEFRYRDASGRGQGWFELALGGQAFTGKWRADGGDAWEVWDGERLAPPPTLHGLFRTEHGPVRLVRSGDAVRGVYRYDGNPGTLEGTVTGGKLSFRWREGAAEGEGWFEQAGPALSGGWRAASEVAAGGEWHPWRGQHEAPDGRRWLLVLEAHWEQDLSEPEYAFGAMLRAYFSRFPQVEVRHRRVHDRADLERALGELPFVPGPSLLVISGHGEQGELVAGADLVAPDPVGAALALAPDVLLVHFSACEMMVGDVARRLRAAAGPSAPPISGYAVPVDWSASAVLEILYFDLVLGRGLSPREAARVVQAELRFAGDGATRGSPLGAARFRLVE